MTAGQGGPPEEPTGRPGGDQGQGGGQPGWTAPPGVPGSPATPQGQPPAPQGYPQGQPQGPQGYPQAPQGYPQAPSGYPPAPQGYPPAPQGYPSAPPPSPWGAQPPPALERPVTVRAGIGALIAHVVLGIVSSIFLFTDQRNLLDQALAQAGANTSQDVVRTALILVAVIALVFVGLELMFLAFAWNGRNWARILLWVLFGLNAVSGLTVAFGGSPYGGFYTSLAVIQLFLAIAGIVLLALKPSNDWYRYRTWVRQTGQGR